MQFMKFKSIFDPNSQKKVIGFDFFDKPFACENDDDSRNMMELYKVSNFKGISEEKLYEIAAELGYAKEKDLFLVKGDIFNTIDEFVEDKPGFRISLLHMDLDLGDPTYFTLTKLYDRVVRGGIIVFDEYNLHKWSESNGVDKFLKEHPELKIKTISWVEYPSAYIVKE